MHITCILKKKKKNYNALFFQIMESSSSVVTSTHIISLSIAIRVAVIVEL